MGFLSETFMEDLLANAILGVALVLVTCTRDLCKRVSRSDCVYDPRDGGLRVKLPTFHRSDSTPTPRRTPPTHPTTPYNCFCFWCGRSTSFRLRA